MGSASALIGIIGGIFGILSLVGGAAIYLRASYAKARIEALNAEIEEEKRRSASLRIDLNALQAKCDIQEAKITALQELVTQRAQLDSLRASIEAMRLDTLTVDRKVNELLEKV